MAIRTLITVERESVEFIVLAGFRDGVQLTSLQYAVVPSFARPEEWKNAEVLEDQTGFYTGTYPPGEYAVYWRATDGTETPVNFAGSFQVR